MFISSSFPFSFRGTFPISRRLPSRPHFRIANTCVYRSPQTTASRLMLPAVARLNIDLCTGDKQRVESPFLLASVFSTNFIQHGALSTPIERKIELYQRSQILLAPSGKRGLPFLESQSTKASARLLVPPTTTLYSSSFPFSIGFCCPPLSLHGKPSITVTNNIDRPLCFISRLNLR